MSFASTKLSWLLACLLTGTVVIGSIAWVLRAERAVAFSFRTDDGKSLLHYSCALARTAAETLALAQQAHAAFQAGVDPIAEQAAGTMHEAMMVANDTGSIPDFGPMEAEKTRQLHRLVAEIEQRFGCVVSQDVPW